MFSLSMFFLLLVVSSLEVAAGFAVGWWLHSSRSTTGGSSTALAQRLSTALGRLQSLAGDMSNQSAKHAERVQAVGKRLDEAASADTAVVPKAVLDGITEILASNRRLQSQLDDVETKLEEQSRQIENQLAEARVDSLTGVANRRAFDEELSRRLAEWRRRHSPVSLLMIDVDHFKNINDTYGHPTGDAVLRDAARVLQATMREMDFTARYGGEEFAIILPATSLRDARRAATRALQAVASARFHHNGEEIGVTISVGLVEVQVMDDAASLVRRADEAMYLAKAAGRNCGYFHDGAEFLALESPRIIVQSASPDAAAKSADNVVSAAPVCESAEADSVLDRLTNLPTAHAFAVELRKRVQRARAGDRPLTLLLFDVDRLAEINQRHGRAAGDQLLRRVADAVRASARDVDCAARYHQGQFALALDATPVEEAIRLAETIRATVRAFSGKESSAAPEATVSCGIAETGPGDRSVALVLRASTALAAAKSAGRDGVFVHDGQNVEPAGETATS